MNIMGTPGIGHMKGTGEIISLLLSAEALVDATCECDETALTKAAQDALSAKEDEEVERLREEICRLRSDTAGALSAKEDEMRSLKENIISRLRNDIAALLEDNSRLRKENATLTGQ
jgi:hypothetical protein